MELPSASVPPLASAGLRRPRIPASVARRIDRLASRAHRFHRFAHHPLCERYRSEVVRLGRRTRLCRGCAMSALGVVLGGVLGVVLRPPPLVALAVAAAATALLLPSLLARRQPRGSRLPKLITRLAPTLLWLFSLGASARTLSWAGLAGSLALVGGAALLYRRRGPDRTPCATCPERDHQPCTGVAPLVLRERAFQRLSRRWLHKAGL
jgi:hypothetical protein